jgi:HAD superfamily hydrolase (TIGR01509 family)
MKLPDTLLGYSGYIFDCDGTLSDSMPLHIRAFHETFQEMTGRALDVPAEERRKRDGVPLRDIIAWLNRDYGCKLDAEAFIRAKKKRFAAYLPQVQPLRPMIDWYRHLRAQRVPVAIASSGTRNAVEQTLRYLELESDFDALVTIEDVAHGKPAPDLVLEAARRLGVAPAQCVVIDDGSPGLAAAAAAGMACVDVRHYKL